MMKHGLNQTECETEGLFMIIAGTETTASVIRSVLVHVMTCPPVYQKLKDEIHTAVQDGSVSEPIAIQEAKKLRYLQVKPRPIERPSWVAQVLMLALGCHIRGNSVAPALAGLHPEGGSQGRREFTRPPRTRRHRHRLQPLRHFALAQAIWPRCRTFPTRATDGGRRAASEADGARHRARVWLRAVDVRGQIHRVHGDQQGRIRGE